MLCLNCGLRPINTKRSKHSCTVCLDSSKRFARKYYPEHKKQIQEAQKKCRAKNPEPYRESHRKYYCKNTEKYLGYGHSRRARLYRVGGNHTTQEWNALVDSVHNRCAGCGKVFTKLERDHIIPISKGGSNDISNIQPMCRTCNARKGTKV